MLADELSTLSLCESNMCAVQGMEFDYFGSAFK